MEYKVLKNRGFSFIGVTIATFVTTMGLIAIFSTANMAISSATVGESRLIASGLAQEGMEIVGDIRMSNVNWGEWEWYSSTTPLVHLVGSSVEYCVQYDSTVLSACPPTETPLNWDSTTLLYSYGDGDASPFYRRIIITRESIDHIKVEVEVKWKTTGQTSWRYLTVEDRLWRWR
ncbi:hypothetical protein ACFLZC_02190 [Patescibacteria group bacterium]